MNSDHRTQRVAVYIDGSNFYFKMKDLGWHAEDLLRFHFRQFAKWLARDRSTISCRYYIGVVRAEDDNQKGQELRKKQQKLFAHLQSPDQQFVIKRGFLMKNDGVYHEKGVDVKLAVDLLAGAYDNLYDTAIVISSDTDLIPAIKKVKHLDKQVEYIGFSHQPSFGMQSSSTLSRLLIKEELEQFFPKLLV